MKFLPANSPTHAGRRLLAAALARLVVLVGLIAPLGCALGQQSALGQQPDDKVFHAQQFYELLDGYHSELEKLAKKCDELQLTEQAEQTRAAVVLRDPGRIYIFPARRDEKRPLPDKPTSGKPGAAVFWRRHFLAIRRDHAEALFVLARRAAESEQSDLAFRLLHETLRADPEHAEARRVLGRRSSSKIQTKQMRLRDPRFGWRSGEYWRITTPHFQVLTNHSAELGRHLGLQLETLYGAWRQVFTGYWLRGSTLRRRFAAESAPLPTNRRKFRVVLFRDQAEYVKTLSPIQSQIGVTSGIYFDEDSAPNGFGRAAYFFGSEPPATTTWFHEATHQLFQETGAVASAVGEQQNNWLIEAVATYMESLERHTSEDGDYFTLGGVDAFRLQYARVRRLSEGFYLPLEDLSKLGRTGLQQHEDVRRLYSQSSGLAHFFMHDDKGRRREAFVRSLRAVYSGRDALATLAEASDTSYGELDEAYTEFLRIGDEDLTTLPPDAQATMLALGQTRITEKGLVLACRLKHLEWLDLAGLPITNRAAAVLPEAQRLQHLNLQSTLVGDAGVAALAKLPNLQWLDLSQTRISDGALSSLAAIVSLEELWLDGTRVTDKGVQRLSQLKNLKILGLEGTAVTQEARSRLRKLMPSLEEIQ